MRAIGIIFSTTAILAAALPTKGGPIWFYDDYEGFVAAARVVQTIDFDTLPDGTSSFPRAEITPDFNYTDEGVTFSTPVPHLFLEGNDVSGYALGADAYPLSVRNWIVGELTVPAFAVGTFYPAYTMVSIYDSAGTLLGSEDYGGQGVLFLGVVSEVPIASVTLDRGTTFAVCNDFVFAPIPEPGTILLVGFGAMALLRARHQVAV